MGDNDAESDTESYFLMPVNEYNIVDKIQSANNLLFASIEEDNMEVEPQHTQNKSDRMLLQSKHRVTFSSDIEEYEDDISETESAEVQYKDDEAIDKEIAEIIERGEKSPENDGIDSLLERLSIEEDNSNDESESDNEYATELEVVEEIQHDDDNVEVDRVQLSVPINDTNVQSVQSANVRIAPTKSNRIEQTNEKDTSCHTCNRGRATSNRLVTKSATITRSTMSERRFGSAKVHRTAPNTNQEELLKIHLNVRSCCENKYLENNRLPRYNGYISQYGLSKDQLEVRALNRQKHIEKRARRDREILRAKQQIADLNEQAFRQWLIRKNRGTRPKYKNMYDSRGETTNQIPFGVYMSKKR